MDEIELKETKIFCEYLCGVCVWVLWISWLYSRVEPLPIPILIGCWLVVVIMFTSAYIGVNAETKIKKIQRRKPPL